ncbi:MAG: DUF2752 domain-containing protein [Acidimicrobiales bacterium]
MPPAVLTRRLGADRAAPAGLALGAVVGAGVIAFINPHAGRYPLCPSAALLGFDCPACGSLRGLHDLSRGRVLDALDHNLLLLVAVPMGAWMWWRWVRAAAGRPPRPARFHPWLAPLAIAVAAVFTVARNLPGDPLIWLAAT